MSLCTQSDLTKLGVEDPFPNLTYTEVQIENFEMKSEVEGKQIAICLTIKIIFRHQNSYVGTLQCWLQRTFNSNQYGLLKLWCFARRR